MVVVPPFDPEQVHRYWPVTDDGVPVVQRLVAGAVLNDPPLALPQVPLIGVPPVPAPNAPISGVLERVLPRKSTGAVAVVL